MIFLYFSFINLYKANFPLFIMALGSNYKIQNIVATASLGKPVPLTKLARTQPN
jgi:TATA-box binding protein (TBP) (component of TFIID and TFIIIB)